VCGLWARDVNTSFIGSSLALGLNGCTVCRWLKIFLKIEIKFIFGVTEPNYGLYNDFFLMHFFVS